MVGLLIVGVTVKLLISNDKDSIETQKDSIEIKKESPVTEVTKSDSPSQQPGVNEQQRAARRAAMKALWLKYKALNLEKEDIEASDIESMTAEELEEGIRRAERRKILDENYWEKAPRAFEIVMDEENKDIHWSNQVVQDGNALLKEHQLAGTTVVQADCRETVCKVVFEHDDVESAEQFRKHQVSSQAPWSGEQYGTRVTEDGKTLTHLYFSQDEEKKAFRKVADIVVSWSTDETAQ